MCILRKEIIYNQKTRKCNIYISPYVRVLTFNKALRNGQ